MKQLMDAIIELISMFATIINDKDEWVQPLHPYTDCMVFNVDGNAGRPISECRCVVFVIRSKPCR